MTHCAGGSPPLRHYSVIGNVLEMDDLVKLALAQAMTIKSSIKDLIGH